MKQEIFEDFFENNPDLKETHKDRIKEIVLKIVKDKELNQALGLPASPMITKIDFKDDRKFNISYTKFYLDIWIGGESMIRVSSLKDDSLKINLMKKYNSGIAIVFDKVKENDSICSILSLKSNENKALKKDLENIFMNEREYILKIDEMIDFLKKNISTETLDILNNRKTFKEIKSSFNKTLKDNGFNIKPISNISDNKLFETKDIEIKKTKALEKVLETSKVSFENFIKTGIETSMYKKLEDFKKNKNLPSFYWYQKEDEGSFETGNKNIFDIDIIKKQTKENVIFSIEVKLNHYYNKYIATKNYPDIIERKLKELEKEVLYILNSMSTIPLLKSLKKKKQSNSKINKM